MAISNAVGSNVFDILLCMGFPWLLSTLFYQTDVPVYSEGELTSQNILKFWWKTFDWK